MIEFRRELGGDFARAFAKLIPALLHHLFAQAVELRLHFLFVPFRRLVDLFACAVANVARLAFQFPEVPADNSLRRFLEQLFDSAQIFPASCQAATKANQGARPSPWPAQSRIRAGQSVPATRCACRCTSWYAGYCGAVRFRLRWRSPSHETT